MKNTYDYGEYERLFRDRQTKRALATIRTVARTLRVRIYLVGGSAVYLLTRNPPVDYPDVDIFVDAEVSEARKLVRRLEQVGFVTILEDDQGDSVFVKMLYGQIEFDLFTTQEGRRRVTRPKKVRGISVEPLEHLVIEKLIRGNYADILMAVDLLTRPYNKGRLFFLANEYRLTGRVLSMIRVAERYKRKTISAESVKRLARMMSRGIE